MNHLVLNKLCLERYCNLLTSKDLIYRDAKNRLHITKKGLAVLRDCYELADFLKPIKKLVDKYSINADDDDTISYLPHM
jgi:predicted transcriptional regulator